MWQGELLDRIYLWKGGGEGGESMCGKLGFCVVVVEWLWHDEIVVVFASILLLFFLLCCCCCCCLWFHGCICVLFHELMPHNPLIGVILSQLMFYNSLVWFKLEEEVFKRWICEEKRWNNRLVLGLLSNNRLTFLQGDKKMIFPLWQSIGPPPKSIGPVKFCENA